MNNKSNNISKKTLPSRHKKVSKLCELRLKKNLTQEDIALDLGCTKSLYAQFERGVQSFNDDQLKIIKDKLGIKSNFKIFRTLKIKSGDNKINRHYCLSSDQKYYVSLLAKKRIEKNKTQEFMAKEINLSRATYIKIEKGVLKINKEVASKLADKLNVKLNGIFVPNYENNLLSVKFRLSKV